MSYILDALRKADAERERDPARGIHAQPLAAQPARGAAGLPVWVWPAAAGVVAVVAGTVLWPREAPVAAAPVAAAVAPAAPAVPAAVPAARVPATVAVADSVSPPAPPPVPAPVARTAVRTPPASPAPALAAPSALPATPGASAQPAAAAPAADRVFAVNELPPEVQRELPRLAISGGVHSENAAQRMLIVGGQVVSEGAEVAPGVVLEQIRAHTAVLRFRGYRYAVGY